MCEVVTRYLPGHLASVAEARAWVRELLAVRLSDTEAIATAELLVSELATNGVRHGCHDLNPDDPNADAGLQLRLFIAARRIRIDVTDPGAGIELSTTNGQATAETTPKVQHPDADSEHGRGLALVDVLAEHWSWRIDNRGCTVSVQLTHTPHHPPDPVQVRQEALLCCVP